jgi:hypothetical protein
VTDRMPAIRSFVSIVRAQKHKTTYASEREPHLRTAAVLPVELDSLDSLGCDSPTVAAEAGVAADSAAASVSA